LQGLIAKYAEQPPDVSFWGPLRKFRPSTGRLGWWREFGRVLMPAKDARFEGLFYPDDDPEGLKGSPGNWYAGTIVKVDAETAETRMCSVLFDDGDKTEYLHSDFTNFNDVRLLSSPDEKIELVNGRARMRASPDPQEGSGETDRPSTGPGPWETWLKTYLPDLLLTIFRVARLDPAQVDKELLGELKCPLSCDDDDVSDAGTPAQPKRARHGDA